MQRRHLVAAVCAAMLLFAPIACLPEALRREYEQRLTQIDTRLASKDAAIAALGEALKAGAITEEKYRTEVARLGAEVEALKTTREEVVDEREAAEDEAVREAVYKGAAIVEDGATIVGPIADKFLPGSGWIIAALGAAAGGVASSHRRRENSGGST